MPKRWLSVRGQKEKDASNVTQAQFDFEFVTEPQDPDFPLTPVRTKAVMFSGPTFRSKKSKNESSRPQSSNGLESAVDKRLQLTKVEDSWIGVAFGSPSHPPPTMPYLAANDGTHSPKHAFPNETPLPITSLSVGRYRRIGKLFKSKSSQLSISAPTNVYKIDGDQKLNMPVAKKTWRKANSPPDWINSENPEFFTAPMADANRITASDHSPAITSTPGRSALPKLEIQIPNVELDRYSVMFSNVSGIKPSSLLERRSKNLSNLKLENSGNVVIPPVPALPLLQPRRPSTPRKHHRRTSSTYSLFPSPPKSKDRTNDIPDKCLPTRQLSFSSRNQNAPDKSTFSSEKNAPKVEVRCATPEMSIPKVVQRCATPELNKPEAFFNSPDDTVASSEKDSSPWRSSESLHSIASSRTSFGSEIFFDLKPAFDCNGREQSQYIIHKPDSPGIERAISEKRKARRAKSQKKSAVKMQSELENGWEDELEAELVYNMSPDLQAAEYMLKVQEKWRLSMELNQAIAEVEKLTSPLGSMSLPLKPCDVFTPIPMSISNNQLPPMSFRKRVGGLAVGIPSPITERSEEFSPRQSLSLPKRIKKQPRRHISSQSIRPAPLKLSNESLPISEDFTITPPPVPIKDARFIPISKFASNSPAVKLVEHRPKRRKPKRAVTESDILPRRYPTLHVKQEKERGRPATISSTTNSSNELLLSPNTFNRVETGIIAVAVKPTAEVSVARTVSLERKQSQQILLSRPMSRISEHVQGTMLNPGRCMSPTIHQGSMVHKPGASLNLVIERAGY